MLRTALKPRWLALLAAVLVVIVAFTMLGLWQLDVARDRGERERLDQMRAQPSVALTELLRPHEVMAPEAVGRTITVTGRYDPAHQVLVGPRRQQGQVGAWVLTPLIVQGTGARLPIIRGFVTDPAWNAPPPAGTVTVSGRLSPPESAPNEPVDLAPGQIQSVDLATLVNEWDGDVYSAMIFSTPAASAHPADAAGLTPVPPPDPDPGGVDWRNLAYALQWWFFAAFAVYMWWRMVRDDHALDEAERAVGENAAAPPPDIDALTPGGSRP